jgi:2-deoxy-D-gluconate 3-dehydrogenase
MNLFDLEGRVAIVTGGNGGIGLAMACGLAQAGATVALAGRDVAKGEAALERLTGEGGRAVFLTADVTDADQCRGLVRDAAQRLGRLDILVNNAGTSIRKAPQDLTEADWHTVLDTNLTSTFLCSQAAYPEMKRAGGGKIVNIGSMLSLFGTSYATAYAASKGGVVQLTRSMATAWARDNIQVNAILPGWIDTELTRGARRQVEGLHQSVLDRTPTGRWGVPDDLQGIAIFLASAASDFVTGAAIPVDGGFSVQG